MHYLTPTIYVSPNEQEGTVVDDAVRQLDEQPMRNLRLQTHGGKDTIGHWTDGAEAGRILHLKDPRHAPALGWKFNQKQVVEYRPDDQGPDQRHIYHGLGKGKTAAEVKQIVAHISPFLTHEVESGDVHILFDSKYGPPPAAQEIEGKLPSVSNGYVRFLGDPAGESRAKAVEIYKALLKGHST